MAVGVSKKRRQDAKTRAIYASLRKAFPSLSDDINEVVYRYNSVSVRVLIVESAFEALSSAERHKLVSRALKELPTEISDDISMLVMRTPEEMNEAPQRGDLIYLEFIDPSRSTLL